MPLQQSTLLFPFSTTGRVEQPQRCKAIRYFYSIIRRRAAKLATRSQLMSEANLTRFRCPQCRSRYMLDVAVETMPYLCPSCHVELEPHGKRVDPSAITAEIAPAAMGAGTQLPHADRPDSMPAPPTAELREIDYLRKIHFWVRFMAVVLLIGLIIGVCQALFR